MHHTSHRPLLEQQSRRGHGQKGVGRVRTWDFCAMLHKETSDNLQVLTSTTLEGIVVICVQRFEILKVPSS